ncbi:MAG: VPLPA-CTERM sorting domain-containing protein [Pseudomonadota bacterium]
MIRFLKRAAAVAAAIAIGSMAHAATFSADFTYQLSDHPDGGQSGNFDYGLRLDREVPPMFWTFDNGSNVILEYDVSEQEARLTGSIFRSLGVGVTGAEYTLRYILTGVTDLGGGFFVQETPASAGSLTLVGPTTATDTQAVISLGTASNGSYFFEFDDDGHRLNNSNGIAGRGWVQSNPGANDFLFTGTLIPPPNNNPNPVPLPAAGWMLIAGMGGLVAMRRRKTAA